MSLRPPEQEDGEEAVGMAQHCYHHCLFPTPPEKEEEEEEMQTQMWRWRCLQVGRRSWEWRRGRQKKTSEMWMKTRWWE